MCIKRCKITIYNISISLNVAAIKKSSSLRFKYLTQCKHHKASMKSWNKPAQNINVILSDCQCWKKMIFPTLKLLKGK